MAEPGFNVDLCDSEAHTVTIMPSASYFNEWYVPIASRVSALKGNENVSLRRRSSAVRGWGNTSYTIVTPYLHVNFELVNSKNAFKDAFKDKTLVEEKYILGPIFP